MTDTNPVSLTRSLLAFDTINPPGDERTCAHYVGGFLEESGFHVDYHEFGTQRTSLVARLVGSGAKSPICFTGHLDTVPLGKMNWSMDPFAGEMDGNRFYGRGTSDMKAAIAGILLMGRRLSELKRRVADIVLVLTAGEETGCQGSRYLAGLGGEVLGEAGAIVVGEPTANQPLIGHKGVARYEIMTAGITAHASMPEQGENAIHKVAEVVQRLQSFNFGVDPHDILGAPTLNIGTITGGININSVPDQARIGIDISGDDHDLIYTLGVHVAQAGLGLVRALMVQIVGLLLGNGGFGVEVTDVEGALDVMLETRPSQGKDIHHAGRPADPLRAETCTGMAVDNKLLGLSVKPHGSL